MFVLRDTREHPFPPDYFRTFEEAVEARGKRRYIDREGEHPGAAYLVVEEVERESRPCRFCGTEVQANDPRVEHCRSCHYSGRLEEESRETQIAFFEEATRATVEVEHTGGGCFWLSFRWEGESDFYVATDGEASLPSLVVCPECEEKVEAVPDGMGHYLVCPTHGRVERFHKEILSGGWGYVGRHSDLEDSDDYEGTAIAGVFVGEYDPEKTNAFFDNYPADALGDSDVVEAILRDRAERRKS